MAKRRLTVSDWLWTIGAMVLGDPRPQVSSMDMLPDDGGPGWRLTWAMDGTWATVMPIDDVVGHEDSDECACNPDVESVQSKDGSGRTVGVVVTHNSWDAREGAEHE